MKAEHDILLGNLAQDYYLSKMSINDISKKYSISRYLILKYLDEALTTGIVDINIHSGYERNVELERKLSKKFNINHLYVIKDPVNPTKRDELIASFSAVQTQAIIKNCNVVGLSWGETVYEVLDHFNKSSQDDLVFTQFMGENMKYKSSSGSMRMVQKAASKYDVPYYTMPGPLYIINDDVRNGFMTEPTSTRVFNIAEKADLLICGLGTLASVDSIDVWHDNKTKIFPRVDLDKIVGMAYGRPYDINGNFLNLDDDKTLSIPLDNILNVSRRFAIVQSKAKYKAALGALRGDFFTDMVMTEAIALRLENEIS
ncbi:sugar-binding transcriptional regulator [Companilactobacillus nodensis]|uniref:Citrate lyase regulator n=1 Tax=Companilactobacillus nodensis DSM 19682 = JCM 14932 = NBRC 107160 TaxID=1423775 RepID=A0A0R1KAA5_9LACO|nr:sugar-binding domain-containing protein [Companilactobacillus nodensis]KRK80396.1 citrate lyase regulator [Companilactobacillus nodensis DSM 19682 = JCM 14932 = NBRC 107160]